jgi:uncharacterized metal-binding protein YceD (DUF177 family)
LAARFGLLAIETLTADVKMDRSKDVVSVFGTFAAKLTQACVASGGPVPVTVAEPLAVQFVPHVAYDPDAEIELDAEGCDTVEHDGLSVDIGEAIAQSLSLALDPFPRAKDADKRLKAAGIQSEGEVTNSAFAGLSALRDKLSG